MIEYKGQVGFIERIYSHKALVKFACPTREGAIFFLLSCCETLIMFSVHSIKYTGKDDERSVLKKDIKILFGANQDITNYMKFWYFTYEKKFLDRRPRYTHEHEADREGKLWDLARKKHTHGKERRIFFSRVKKWKADYFKRVDEIRGMYCVLSRRHVVCSRMNTPSLTLLLNYV